MPDKCASAFRGIRGRYAAVRGLPLSLLIGHYFVLPIISLIGLLLLSNVGSWLDCGSTIETTRAAVRVMSWGTNIGFRTCIIQLILVWLITIIMSVLIISFTDNRLHWYACQAGCLSRITFVSILIYFDTGEFFYISIIWIIISERGKTLNIDCQIKLSKNNLRNTFSFSLSEKLWRQIDLFSFQTRLRHIEDFVAL